MLNSYIKLLKHATEALTNVGGSNAGAAEYFQAVGYEFVIIAIGLLYLAGIAAIVAVPVLVFRQGVYKGGFASKTLKKFSEIVLDCDKAKGEYHRLCSSFESSKKESRIEAYEKLCTLLTKYCNAFTPLNWYECIPGDTIEDKRRFLKEDKHFSNILQSLPSLPPCLIGDASFNSVIRPDEFYYMTHSDKWASVFADRVKELYPSDTDYRHDLRRFQIRCKIIPAIVLVLYAIFMLPLCLMFF